MCPSGVAEIPESKKKTDVVFVLRAWNSAQQVVEWPEVLANLSRGRSSEQTSHTCDRGHTVGG